MYLPLELPPATCSTHAPLSGCEKVYFSFPFKSMNLLNVQRTTTPTILNSQTACQKQMRPSSLETCYFTYLTLHLGVICKATNLQQLSWVTWECGTDARCVPCSFMYSPEQMLRLFIGLSGAFLRLGLEGKWFPKFCDVTKNSRSFKRERLQMAQTPGASSPLSQNP